MSSVLDSPHDQLLCPCDKLILQGLYCYPLHVPGVALLSLGLLQVFWLHQDKLGVLSHHQ